MRILSYLFFGAIYWIGRRFFGRRVPFIAGLVLNESCNLACAHCQVRRKDRSSDSSWNEVIVALEDFRAQGIRNLAITGGEPFFWRSAGHTVADVIRVAREKGFLAVTVYTNGTLPFSDCGADAVLVGPHGMEAVDDSDEGSAWQKCRANIEVSTHPNIILNYTINSRNSTRLREVCAFVRDNPHIHGVFFYFHTPYYGFDDLFQPMDVKRRIVDEILGLKREGFPIFNSTAALKAFADDGWQRPSDLCLVWERGRTFRCCRSNGNEEGCRNCGYLGYLELDRILALCPSAIREGLNYIAQ